MKIKTLTTYNVYNYGASLQAFALMRYLQKEGHSVEIINYQPEYLTRWYNYKWVNPESPMSKYSFTRFIYRILKFLQRQTTLKSKKKFDYFNHKILNETKQIYHSYNELKDNPPKADLYIVGSDQIWNTYYETGKDPAFYLDFVNEGIKASYAASFSYIDINNQEKDRIKSSLNTFEHVSVREFHGLKILQDMNIKGTWVLDPVFLLAVDDWKRIMTKFEKKEKYLLIYDFERDKSIKEFAQLYAKANGLKIYAINSAYPTIYAHRNFPNTGPKEFITLIYNCDAFVSNSFHGTAFSIIFNKPVFIFNRQKHKVNSRMESLAKLFEIENCILPHDGDYSSTLNIKFDFDNINKIKEREIATSKKFIQNLFS